MAKSHSIPTVLIVDDTFFQRVKLRMFFEGRGFIVEDEAEDGKKGVQLFKKFRPDLVTMDVNMPFMNGIEALIEIRRIDPDARVIMVSAMGNPETIKQARDAGAEDFVIKPFTIEDLQKKVKNALNDKFQDFFSEP
jgi:two-component system chemotaxis response regulator CheY